VRRLPSGRFQASFTPPCGQRQTATTTFGTGADASRYVDRVELDINRGHCVKERLRRPHSPGML